MKAYEFVLRHVAWPLIDLKNHSGRLRELRRLEKTQWQPATVRAAGQALMLQETIARAARDVPYYRERWDKLPAIRTIADLAQVPLLTKAEVRQHAAALKSSAFLRDSLIEARTGGSTGVALIVHFDDDCQQKRNAAAYRSNTWAGWKPAMEAGALWGNAPIARGWREKVRHFLSERLVYLDTVDMSPADIARFMATLKRKDIRAIYGHAHSLYMLAVCAQRDGIEPPSLDAIVSTSMVLLDNERAFIERYFSCKVTNRYGCEEVGLIASECEQHDGLHINDDHLVVEILDEANLPVSPGTVGKIVVTDLINHGMPLIRYQIGDMSSWMEGVCKCGRAMPRLAKVAGRVADFLKRGDGRLVAGVSLVERTLTAIPGVDQMQIVQPAIDDLRLKIVLAKGHDAQAAGRQLATVMTEAFGPSVQCTIDFVAALDQDANGKYRFAICQC